MKKIILTIASVILISISLFQPVMADDKNEKSAKIIELMRITGMDAMFSEIIRKTAPAIRVQLQDSPLNIKPEDIDVLVDFTAEELIANQSDALEKMVPIYEKHLTIAEIDAAIEFYSKPEAQSLLKKMPSLMQESMLMGQEWGKNVMVRAMKRIQEKLKEMGYQA